MQIINKETNVNVETKPIISEYIEKRTNRKSLSYTVVLSKLGGTAESSSPRNT